MRLKINRLKALAALSTAGVLILSSVGYALASSPAQDSAKKAGLFGSVSAKSEGSFTLTTNKGSNLDLSVSQDTVFHIAGESQATLEEVPLGSRVAILAEGDASSMVALKVMVVPSKPITEHRHLRVVEASGSTVVALDARGNRIKVELEDKVSPDIKGRLVVFVGVRGQNREHFNARTFIGAKGESRASSEKAAAVVKIREVVGIEGARAVGGEVEATASSGQGAKPDAHALAELGARLEANMQRHVEQFTRVIAEAPEQAKASLKAALEMTIKGYNIALEAIARLQSDAEAKGKAEGEIESKTEGKAGGRAEAEAHGSVQSMDIANHKATLLLRDGSILELGLSSDTVIRINGKASTEANLEAGMMVEVRYDTKTNTAIRINATVKSQAELHMPDRPGVNIGLESHGGAKIEARRGTEIEVIGVPGLDVDASSRGKAASEATSPPMIEVIGVPGLNGEVAGSARSEAKAEAEGRAHTEVEVIGVPGLEVEASEQARVEADVETNASTQVGGALQGHIPLR